MAEPAPRKPAAQHHPVFVFPTPDKRDLLFFVEKDARLPGNANLQWTYGDQFWDKTRYPNHKLVYVSAQTEDNWSRWYYAADWQDQDNHNWVFNGGQELIRTYLVPRALYRQKPVGFGGALAGEFLYPPAATLDATFTDYGFADDTVLDAPQELKGLYILVRRRLIEPVTEEVKFMEEFQRHVRIRRELVQPAVSPAVPAVPANGSKIEMLHGNKFHDVMVTYTMNLAADTISGHISWLASTNYDTRDYNFPAQLLDPVNIPYITMWADSTEAASSYSLDFYFDFKIEEPRQGPYAATTLIYFTNDPAALLALWPLTVIPNPQRETIPAAFGWWYASTKGNSTFAYCKQIEVPATVHEEVNVNQSENGGVTPTTGTSIIPVSATLPATPGFAAFKALSNATLDVEVRKVDMGLYRVVVTRLNIAGIYA